MKQVKVRYQRIYVADVIVDFEIPNEVTNIEGYLIDHYNVTDEAEEQGLGSDMDTKWDGDNWEIIEVHN